MVYSFISHPAFKSTRKVLYFHVSISLCFQSDRLTTELHPGAGVEYASKILCRKKEKCCSILRPGASCLELRLHVRSTG